MSIVESTELPNGVRVLTERVPTARGVGIATLVDASPQDESVESCGLAHLCEHAFFMGTHLRTETEIASLIDSAGGQLGGFTARDYTCLYANVSNDYVTYALDLLGDMLTNNDFTAERLEREKVVIGHEIDAHEDSADAWLDSELKRTAWQDDPIGRSLLGTRDSVATLTPDDVHGFVHKNYTPDRIIVAAVGDLEHAAFVDQTHDALWQSQGEDLRTGRPQAEFNGGLLVQPRPMRQSHATILLPAPGYTDSDRYAIHVLVNLLGGGMSSRLYRNLRETRGLVYSVSSQLHAYGRGSVIAIELSTSADGVMPSLAAVFEQLTELAWNDQSVDEEELWKAKMQTRGQAYLASDSIQTRVSRLATQCFYFGQCLNDGSLLDGIDAVAREDVTRVAARVIGDGLASTAIGVTGGLGQDAESLRSEIAGLQGCFLSQAGFPAGR
ncbi:MAG: pitrilysin family protein [Planctomycetota bacterium]